MIIKFAKNVETDEIVSLNLEKLVSGRCLVQANSGGGKSYKLRKILEVTNKHVQQIVIDPEGEYSTLREKFDYILVGKKEEG